MKKNLTIFFLLIIAVVFAYNIFIPIKYSNSCNDRNLYRYRFAVYKIDTNIVNEIKKEKFGGFANFLGIREVECFDTLLKVKLTAQKKSIDSLHKLQGWRILNCGLWINKKGDLAFKTDYPLRGDSKLEVWSSRFMTNFGYGEEENATLKSVIDTATFRQLTYSFYRDKNNIYEHYDMLGGGWFANFKDVEPKVDVATFRMLNGYYARDANFIYDGRNGIISNTDVKTFIVLKDEPFAKDKNNYYQWDSIIEKEQMKDSTTKEAIRKLNNLN